MSAFSRIFPHARGNIIGMIHVKALPGTPSSSLSVPKIVESAVREAKVYQELGLDSVLIENMHDIPYVQRIGPEITSVMTAVSCAVASVLPQDFPIGIQVLAGGNKEALSVALAANVQYIRAEGYVFAHVADEGLIQACAGDLLRFRRAIGAQGIAAFSDIKKKHASHSLTADLSLSETIRAAEFFASDGVILTGKETGDRVSPGDLKEAEGSSSLPLLIGSGVTTENLESYMSAHALIVGSHFKEGGHWARDLDPYRIEEFMEQVFESRGKQE
uniref:F13E9.13, mitochondrial n=1 Tax=Caligus rogercresseyi TaxID=217165 RepID=C1BQ09_CALRO|nr:F13E9.13, mitochondrial precursor [Caligus rogercresseyi]